MLSLLKKQDSKINILFFYSFFSKKSVYFESQTKIFVERCCSCNQLNNVHFSFKYLLVGVESMKLAARRRQINQRIQGDQKSEQGRKINFKPFGEGRRR